MTSVTLPGIGLPIAVDFIAAENHQLMKMEFGAAGSVTQVSDAAPLPVKTLQGGFISTANSSAVALGISGVFTGASEDVTEYADVRIFVVSDQASAVDGLQIQQSSNGTNWDVSDPYSIPAATGKIFSIGVSAKFFRIVYTNGTTAQTAFRLQVKLGKVHSRPSSVRPQDGRGNDNDMDEVLGHLMGYNGTGWDRMRGSIANGLAVDVVRLPALTTGANIIGAANVNTANVSGTTTLHNATASAGLTVGANLPITGYGTSVLKVTGTFAANLAFKVSQDGGATWDPISATQVGGGDIFVVATQPGSYRLTVAGFDLLRVEVTLSAGAVTITGKSTNAVNASKIVKLATGGLVIGAVNIAPAQTLAAVTAITNALPPGTNSIGAVTGVFFQTTQPVSIAAMPSTPVTGTFFQTTQPVSGAFFQTTQPVSMATAPTTPVTGTFFQATQPVSIAAAQTLATVTTVSTVSTVASSTPAVSTTTAATLSSLASTNANLVKSSAGSLYSVTASNVGAAAAFLKVFNLATAPTVGTSVPFLTIPIAPSGVANINFGAQGMRMSAGISFSITNLVADADATAIAAAQVKVAIAYI